MTTSEILHGAGLDAVIGMYSVVHRLRTTVVTPLVAGALGDPLVRAPKRVLLYGPPRCGGRFIARHLAVEIEALSPLRTAVVEHVERLGGDDAVVRTLDAAESTSDVVIATGHEPWDLPAAALARFDRFAFVHPPDWEARRFRLWESSLGRIVAGEDLEHFVSATEGWCGTDLAATFSSIAVAELQQARAQAALGEGAVTSAWLAKAREFVHDRDEGFDDLIAYLQRMRRW